MPAIHVLIARLGVVASVAVLLSSPALAAQKKDDKKMKDNERQEAQVLVRAVDHAMTAPEVAGASAWTVDLSKKEGAVTPAEGAPTVSWRHDTLKAQEGKIYVPFVVDFPADAFGSPVSPDVAFYLRVAPKGATGGAPAAEKDKREGMFPFEDVHFTQVTSGEQGKSKLARAFSVAAGPYDVYVAMMPHLQEREKKMPPVRVVLLKQSIDIPNYWDSELNTSSIIVADKVEGLTAPLSPEQQRERPYVLGQTEIVPAVDSAFKKSEELTIIFQIYNPVFENKKPDVTVDYAFFRKDGEAEKPFNKMAPQQFNAQTLPPQFDPDAGFQIAAGWSVPLQSFPEGNYHLQIKVQDNKGQKSITRDVVFSVTGS
jgi:hypothetical protein